MSRISTRRLAQVTRRIGLSLRAGLDVRKIWQQESARGPTAHQRVMSGVSEKILKGDNVAEAMRASGGYFPELACELVDVGERTGTLESVLLKLADHYDHVLTMRRIFLTGIAWPMLQLGFGIGVIGLLIAILGWIGGANPTVTFFGLAGTRGVLIYLGIILTAAAVIAMFVIGLVRGWFGTLPIRVILRVPNVGKQIQTMAMARLAWTLGMSLESGTDAERSIQMALRSTQLDYYQRYSDQVQRVIRRGGEFHEALRETGAFPDEFVDLLETAEVSGTQSESLIRLSNQYQEQAEAAMKVLSMIAAFVVWAGIALIFVVVIISMVQSIYINPIQNALDELSLAGPRLNHPT